MSTRVALGDGEAAPKPEHLLLALDEDRLGAERARRLVAWDDAADRRRDHEIDLAEARLGLRRERPAKTLGALRVAEDEVLLQIERRAKAGGQNEMAFEQGPRGAKFVQHLIRRHLSASLVGTRSSARNCRFVPAFAHRFGMSPFT